jgi:hypothetical protein
LLVLSKSMWREIEMKIKLTFVLMRCVNKTNVRTSRRLLLMDYRTIIAIAIRWSCQTQNSFHTSCSTISILVTLFTISVNHIVNCHINTQNHNKKIILIIPLRLIINQITISLHTVVLHEHLQIRKSKTRRTFEKCLQILLGYIETQQQMKQPVGRALFPFYDDDHCTN